MGRRPARWVWAVLAVVLVAAGAGALVLPREDASGATATVRSVPPLVRVLIVGDSYTTGTEIGGLGDRNWTQQATADLRAEGYLLEVEVEAGGGSGYVKGGLRGLTFRQFAAMHGGGFDLVVFFGSRNDLGGVLDAARSTFAAAGQSSPGADLLVIGPPWTEQEPPARAYTTRAALARAADEFGGTFVDPLAERWFGGDVDGLIGSDGIHPTDAGHDYLADRIEPRLRDALERRQ